MKPYLDLPVIVIKPGDDYMITILDGDEYWSDLESYLEHCWACESDPVEDQVVLAGFRPASIGHFGDNLIEYIVDPEYGAACQDGKFQAYELLDMLCEQMPEDWEYERYELQDWCVLLIALINQKIEEHKNDSMWENQSPPGWVSELEDHVNQVLEDNRIGAYWPISYRPEIPEGWREQMAEADRQMWARVAEMRKAEQ